MVERHGCVSQHAPVTGRDEEAALDPNVDGLVGQADGAEAFT